METNWDLAANLVLLGTFVAVVIVAIVIGLAFYTTHRKHRGLLEPLRQILDERSSETDGLYISHHVSRRSGISTVE